MRLFIASEFRCHMHKNKYYLSEKAYSIYKRYSLAFGKVVLCSRFIKLESFDNAEEKLIEADFIDGSVEINSLFKALMGIYDKKIEDGMKGCDLTIVRLPSVTAYRAADIAKKMGIPYLAELMCDGWDPYWNHGLRGKLMAAYMHNKMKKVTYNANYAIYVTEKFLQNRYPCKNKSINASNVLIKKVDRQLLENRLQLIRSKEDKNKISIMTTANINLRSKGQRFVVRAMGKLKKSGINVTYYLAGGGDEEHLRQEAEKAGVSNQIVFLGQLPLAEVYKYIDKIDIYIQPSLQEGLPRAVIEAMSRACPCLGARTAGIPELLSEECIFEKASAIAITDAIRRIINSNLEKYAVANFKRSMEYTEEALNKRRNDYFISLKKDLESK